MLCFFFLCIFPFLPLGRTLSISCYFFTAETAENEFRRAGRAYILIEEGELD